MLGTVVNTVAIIAGSLLGLLFKGGIPESYNRTVLKSVALAVLLIGLLNALKTEQILLLIFSLAIGSLLGEVIKIEEWLDRLGNWLESRFASSGGSVAEGFVSASLLFCVGAMAIVGSLESGLSGSHQTLFAKSVLDGIASIVLASSLGIGVLFSAASVFIYQGLITLASSALQPFLGAAVIREMSAVGGLLIMSIGFNMLDFPRIKVGNMLPAIFIPLIYYMLLPLWNSLKVFL
ncbi:MAG TPA: DUF554 domain-containing protein [Syntrophomonadaceae bacterium]|nr:DUF554 domain-containing protein [Syntrophomonadaceae bacterium]